jgi:acetyltransferase
VAERVELADGTPLEVRPVEPGDKAALRRGLASLSPESSYRRFLAPTVRLSDRQLRRLTELDRDQADALVALEPDGDTALAVARYVRDPGDRRRAEFAIVVTDAWQGRGIASLLSRRLIERARAGGVSILHATVLADNDQVLDALSRGGWRVVERGRDVVDLEVDLNATDPGDLWLGEALRAAARRLLRMARAPLPGGD